LNLAVPVLYKEQVL